jgi:hypothetical protein
MRIPNTGENYVVHVFGIKKSYILPQIPTILYNIRMISEGIHKRNTDVHVPGITWRAPPSYSRHGRAWADARGSCR